MILNLPDVRQRNNWSCSEAAVRTVFEYHGAKGKLPVSSPIDGADPRTLEGALHRAGLVLQSGRMDLEDLRFHTRKGRPVICLVRNQNNDSGHYVVVAGVSRGQVHFQCSTYGFAKQKAGAFEDRWWDIDRGGMKIVSWGIAVWGEG